MNAIWIVSMILLWIVIALLVLLVLSLVRQLGALTLRVNALKEVSAEGPALYSRIPQHEVSLAGGDRFLLGGERERPALVGG